MLSMLALPLLGVIWRYVSAAKHDLEALIAKEGLQSFLGKCGIAVLLTLLMWIGSREQEKAAQTMVEVSKRTAPKMGPAPNPAVQSKKEEAKSD